jgi:hypothetical protein
VRASHAVAPLGLAEEAGKLLKQLMGKKSCNSPERVRQTVVAAHCNGNACCDEDPMSVQSPLDDSVGPLFNSVARTLGMGWDWAERGVVQERTYTVGLVFFSTLQL